MKRLTYLLCMIVTAAWGGVSGAELPRTINLQTMVYDLDGNVTRSEFVGVSVQIVDENGQVYYQEDHTDVPIVQGAMNLLIGEATGGISLDALDPAEGRRFVNVLVDNTSPYDILPISSVPYAIWADRAQSVIPDAIEGDNIKEGSIEPRHLAGDFQIDKMSGTLVDTQIPETIVRQVAFDEHTGSTTAHPAGSIPVVTGAAYPLHMGNTVQIALEKLYNAYTVESQTRQTTDGTLSTAITAETNARQTGDSNLSAALAVETSARQAADAAIQAQLNVSPAPNQYYVNAWCHVTACLNNPVVADCANASVAPASITQCRVTFNASMSSASYSVVTTTPVTVASRDASGFTVNCNGSCSFDFTAVGR